MTKDDTSKHHSVFIILLAAPILISLIFTANYLVNKNPHGIFAPRNYHVYDFSVHNADVSVALPNMVIPVLNAFDSKKANVTVDIYPQQNNIQIQNIRLSSNDSSLFIGSSTLSKNSSSPRFLSYTIPVEGWHRLQVTNRTETYNLHITMTNNSSAKNPTIVTKTEDFKWPIQTQDLNNLMYFSIIFIGVLISRIFPLRSDTSSDTIGNTKTADDTKGSAHTFKLRPVELAWVPFSAIITLIIFVSFHSQVRLGTDIITNIATAFGFGFAFDKILNVGTRP